MCAKLAENNTKLQAKLTDLESCSRRNNIRIIVEQRREYQEVMSELYQRGFKPALLFPARLNITLKDGARKRLSSVSEAKDFIADNQSGIGSHASSSA
ncbi:hypothetical protein KUCAC02_001418 [Chaenocephalus aceratus]|uniref:Uncharacterized protein n=1 Tax=Chaenocephalus aceratus TaxID=36190 RepID=A0ACB9XRI1_CHAAC|nr:hypothetical protein KUCAC02_001418 [Chaenocephalus aceratus]